MAYEKRYDGKDRWICIYPAYINSKKTKNEGRRTQKVRSVENPTAQEIDEALKHAGFSTFLENKKYSREKSNEQSFIGRVRVQLKNEDGTLCNAEIPNRESVMRQACIGVHRIRAKAPKTNTDHGRSDASKKKGKGRK